MKPRILSTARLSIPLATALAALLSTHSVQAQTTRFWDQNGTTAGFGAASGTWTDPTASRWSNGTGASAGTATPGASITTAINDSLNFGGDNATNSPGLTTGTITVTGTVNAGSIKFGSQTTATVILNGGTINLGAVATIQVGAGGNTVQVINSTITGAGTSLTKTGGRLVLNATNNNYSGATNINGGALIYRNTGAKSASSTHTFAATTTIGLGVGGAGFFGSTDIDNAFAGTTGGNLGNVVLAADTSVGIDTTAGNFTYATSVAGSPTRGLTKLSTNTLTLQGANTFTGQTIIGGGTLRLENTAAVQNSSLVSVSSGTTLQLAANSSSTFNTTGVSLTSATIVSDRLVAGDGVTHALGIAAISNSTHNFTAGSLVTNTGTAAIQFSGMTNASGGGGSATLNPTTANVIITGGYTNLVNTGTNNLILSGTSAGNSIGGVIENGTRTGTGQSLTKSGTSTWTLNGDNTYSGATAVNGGTLIINGDQIAASGAVSVAAGSALDTPLAKLGGTGIIGGNVTLTAESAGGSRNGGVLAPTAALSTVAKLTVAGTTTFGTGSLFEWNMSAATPSVDSGVAANSGSYGQLAGAGTIGGSNAVFNVVLGAGNAFTDAFWNSSKSWSNIFTGAGAPTDLTTIFSSIRGAGLTWADGKAAFGDISPGGDGGYFTLASSTLTWTAVPEPTSALAGLLLGAGLLRRRRNVGC